MRPLFVPTILVGAMMLSAAPASAQPALYVCTPSAQVLEVNAATKATKLVYTDTSGAAFNDCVLGPDGQLYVAAADKILRVDVRKAIATADLIVSLSFSPTGLAFNVSTLYISGGAGVFAAEASDPGDGSLIFGPVTSTPVVPASAARGVVFDYHGNLVVAAGSNVYSVPEPSYAGLQTALASSAVAAVGVALNTCRGIVFADSTTKKILLASGGDTGLKFGNKDIPLYIEVASDNTMYIVTAESLAGANGKIWAAKFDFATCSSTPAALLVELKTKLSGPNKVNGLLSASAIGLGVAATDHELTREFTGADCSEAYDFGYHKAVLTFADCGATFPGSAKAKIKVEALKSTLADVSFTPSLAFPSGTRFEGMRYSPMGGFIVQYRYSVVSGDPFPAPFQSLFVFETQDDVNTPGVARAPDIFDNAGNLIALAGRTDPYTENVGDDYWATDIDPAGARGDDISKRVVFNASLNQECTLTFDEPFDSEKPLFKVGQAINFKVTAKRVAAPHQACNGGTVRISISKKLSDGTVQLLHVTSVSAGTAANIMNQTGAGKYGYNADSASFGTGDFQAFFWGNLSKPIMREFTISK